MSNNMLCYNFVYIGFSFIVILTILIFIQIYKNKNYYVNDKAVILIKTPKGIVKSENKKILDELESLKTSLINSSAGVHENCENLTPQINNSIQNLKNFINDNLSNSELLCNVELKAKLTDQYMNGSITPEPIDWENSYKSLLEWEDTERELPLVAIDRLKYLINNIDIAIKLLRFNVCNNGYVDIEQLHKLLLTLNNQICNTGKMYLPDGNEITFKKDPYVIYNKPPPLPLFIRDQYSLEPFETKPNIIRKLPNISSFGKITFNGQANDYSNINNSDNYNGDTSKDLLQSTDRLVPSNDFSGLTESIEIGDRTFEGSVENDILGYKPPGTIISQLHDSSDNYTVNVNVCGGKIVSDDEIMDKCVSTELPLFEALNGDSSQMLNCIGDCDQEPNYTNWYNKLEIASKDSDFLLTDLDKDA